MFLGVLHRLGLPLTLPIAHLIAVVLMICVALSLQHILRHFVGIWPAFVTVMSIAIVWSAGSMPWHTDFLSLATELGPLAAMAVGLCLATSTPSTARVALALLLFGCMPLLKYQFVFMAIGATAVAIVAQVNHGARLTVKTTLLRLCTFAVPGVVVVCTALANGRGGRLLDEAFPVIGTHFVVADTTYPARISTSLASTVGYPFFFLPWVLASLTIIVQSRERWRRVCAPIGLVVSLALVVPSLAVLPRMYPHYSYLVLAGSLLACAWALVMIEHDKVPVRVVVRPIVSLIGVVALLVGLGYSYDPLSHPLRATYAGPWSRVLSTTPISFGINDGLRDSLIRTCPRGSTVLVWGWSPEMFSFYDWQPSSRYTLATWFTSPGSDKRPYYRHLRDELHSERPDCIVEAIGPAFFGNFAHTTTLSATVPGVGQFLRANYVPRTIQYLGNGTRAQITVYSPTRTVLQVSASEPVRVETTPLGGLS